MRDEQERINHTETTGLKPWLKKVACGLVAVLLWEQPLWAAPEMLAPAAATRLQQRKVIDPPQISLEVETAKASPKVSFSLSETLSRITNLLLTLPSGLRRPRFFSKLPRLLQVGIFVLVLMSPIRSFASYFSPLDEKSISAIPGVWRSGSEETLWGISREFLESLGTQTPSNQEIARLVEILAEHNQILNPDLIHPGEPITLPLQEISEKFDVDPTRISQAVESLLGVPTQSTPLAETLATPLEPEPGALAGVEDGSSSFLGWSGNPFVLILLLAAAGLFLGWVAVQNIPKIYRYLKPSLVGAVFVVAASLFFNHTMPLSPAVIEAYPPGATSVPVVWDGQGRAVEWKVHINEITGRRGGYYLLKSLKELHQGDYVELVEKVEDSLGISFAGQMYQVVYHEEQWWLRKVAMYQEEEEEEQSKVNLMFSAMSRREVVEVYLYRTAWLKEGDFLPVGGGGLEVRMAIELYGVYTPYEFTLEQGPQGNVLLKDMNGETAIELQLSYDSNLTVREVVSHMRQETADAQSSLAVWLKSQRMRTLADEPVIRQQNGIKIFTMPKKPIAERMKVDLPNPVVGKPIVIEEPARFALKELEPEELEGIKVKGASLDSPLFEAAKQRSGSKEPPVRVAVRQESLEPSSELAEFTLAGKSLKETKGEMEEFPSLNAENPKADARVAASTHSIQPSAERLSGTQEPRKIEWGAVIALREGSGARNQPVAWVGQQRKVESNEIGDAKLSAVVPRQAPVPAERVDEKKGDLGVREAPGFSEPVTIKNESLLNLTKTEEPAPVVRLTPTPDEFPGGEVKATLPTERLDKQTPVVKVPAQNQAPPTEAPKVERTPVSGKLSEVPAVGSEPAPTEPEPAPEVKKSQPPTQLILRPFDIQLALGILWTGAAMISSLLALTWYTIDKYKASWRARGIKKWIPWTFLFFSFFSPEIAHAALLDWSQDSTLLAWMIVTILVTAAFIAIPIVAYNWIKRKEIHWVIVPILALAFVTFVSMSLYGSNQYSAHSAFHTAQEMSEIPTTSIQGSTTTLQEDPELEAWRKTLNQWKVQFQDDPIQRSLREFERGFWKKMAKLGVHHLPTPKDPRWEEGIPTEVALELDKNMIRLKELQNGSPEQGAIAASMQTRLGELFHDEMEVLAISLNRYLEDRQVEKRRLNLGETMVGIADNHRIPRSIFMGVLFVESRFDPRAYNTESGASGLGQLMPSAVRAVFGGLSEDLKERYYDKGLFDPYVNMEISAAYLKYLYNKYSSWMLAVMAYYIGEGNLDVRGAKAFGVEDYRHYLLNVLLASEHYRTQPVAMAPPVTSLPSLGYLHLLETSV